ncbi:hypothetical protein [Burkholderia cenocepacia]|uniref:hypothetical protein n=1 Tax=Burkholderia cenocepacia TaxID=95486 RepID=UPI001F4951EA|nr:hypothetical protein [Burkholderia cenocepacia]MCW5178962.1 hypothetical protein [Burkholderia cenocepacia]
MTTEAHTMTTQNEKSPLTRNASGQENGTEIEARGLSSAVNGTQTENLTSRKSPAPEQASEATAARPSMEDSTAEGIVDARTTGGNETSSKVSRADALTADEREVLEHTAGFLHATAATALRKLLAASPVERPAAAPKPVVLEHVAVAEDGGRLRWMTGRKPRDCELYAAPDGCHAPFLYVAPQPAPAPADERAAFERHQGYPRPEYDGAAQEAWDYHRKTWLAALAFARASSANETGAEGAPRYAEWLHLRTHGEWSDGVPAWARDHTGRMNDFTAATAVIEELAAARAFSANETEAEVAAVAWMRANDPRDCISDAKKRDMIEHAGAPGARLAENYAIALGKIAPVQPAEPVAEVVRERFAGRDRWDFKIFDRTLQHGAKLYAAPQPPAQAHARERLTDEQREAIDWAIQSAEWTRPVAGSVMRARAHALRALLAARPGQAEPRAALTDSQRDKIERAEVCLRNTGRKEDCEAANGLLDVLTEHPLLPEPSAEASPDDHRDGTRWRALMKNGEPEVFVERTQRRAIQRTQTVAFSSPNLTGADRFDIPSEMWVKRYVMFAWWARENEHRKFVEAVDAISASEIQ